MNDYGPAPKKQKVFMLKVDILWLVRMWKKLTVRKDKHFSDDEVQEIKDRVK